MSKITTVVFDAFGLFGTLFQDSPEHWDAAMEQIIRRQGLAVSVETLNREWLVACGDFRNTRSESTADFQSYTVAWRDAFVEAFRVLNLAGDAAAAADHWIRDMGRGPPALPGNLGQGSGGEPGGLFFMDARRRFPYPDGYTTPNE